MNAVAKAVRLAVSVISTACIAAAASSGWGQSKDANPSAADIVNRMMAKNQERAERAPGFACDRSYTLDYSGFPGARHAEMKVRAVQTKNSKDLTIVSESGSGPLRNHVFRELLSTEREAASGKLHEESKLVPGNFRFDLVGQERTQDGASYVLEVTPVAKSKVAWRGKVWVNSTDYAVVRAEGHPEKMPSWWTVESNFVSTYQKLDEIWVPASNVSDTRVRFGGHAHLVIDYGVCHSIASSDAGAIPHLSPGDTSIRSPEQLSK